MNVRMTKQQANDLRKAIWFMAQGCRDHKNKDMVTLSDENLDALQMTREGLTKLLVLEETIKQQLNSNGKSINRRNKAKQRSVA